MVPAVFEIDDDGRLAIVHETVSPDRLDAVRSAIASCPTQALSLMESER
jgi:ferredoxin